MSENRRMWLKRRWSGFTLMIEDDQVIFLSLRTNKPGFRGATYTSALLSLSQTSQAEAQQDEIDDYYLHRNDCFVLLRLCCADGGNFRCCLTWYCLGGG